MMNDKSKGPKSLGAQSRSAINRNVKQERLDSLPLPQSLKDECFERVAEDRGSEGPARQTLDPCDKGCCSFPTEDEASQIRHGYQIRHWSEKSKSKCGAHLIYSRTLPGLKTSADWLELPDRSTLLERYRANPARERLAACLNTLRFDPTTGLGDVHEWIRRFLYYEHEHGWYHVSVAAGGVKSFLEAVRNLTDASAIVALPYGCVTDGGTTRGDDDEFACLAKHRRRMILAVKDDDSDFKRALLRIGFGFEKGSSYFGRVVTSVRINGIGHFVNAIAYVSRAKFDNTGNSERHYVVFNPMIWHAIWWMHLLVPGGHLDGFARFRMGAGVEGGGEKKRAHAATELQLENCVVRFEPLHQFIGDPVEDLVERVSKKRPFVFWFGRRVLNVEEAINLPRFVLSATDPKRRFVEWCVSRQMNTLLNLNGNCWVEPVEGNDGWNTLYDLN